MVDNIQLIKTLLMFDSDDDYFHCQIIKRKKENPEIGSNNYCVKSYYVSSLEYLDNKYEEMKALATFHNARVCINLNRRSFEKMAFHTLRKVADQIMNKDFRSVRKAYESVCGSYSNEVHKKWIVDIDTHDLLTITNIRNGAESCEPKTEHSKIYATIPTKNGVHLITTPFRLDQFKIQYPGTDTHKDNPTILYIP